MRLFIVVGLLVAAVFITVIVLVNLVSDLSRLSYRAPLDLDDSDDWDPEMDEFADAAPPVTSYAAQLATSRDRDRRPHGDVTLGKSNALDDVHSAHF